MQKASLAASGMLTWPARTAFTGLAPPSNRSRKASRSSGANWSAAPWSVPRTRGTIRPDLLQPRAKYVP
jgi:hypothetical protein